jgi:regulator of protease activity HflC (stomatin/prohibitin superfamily)
MIAVDVIVVLVIAALVGVAMSIRIIKQYERVVLFGLGKVNRGRRPASVQSLPTTSRRA